MGEKGDIANTTDWDSISGSRPHSRLKRKKNDSAE